MIRVNDKRSGCNKVGQLLTDVLNVEEGAPRSLRVRRFVKKWELEDWGRLRTEIYRLTKNGIGNPPAPVYRNLDGEIHLDDGSWIYVQENPEAPIPAEVLEKKIKIVRRGRARRQDRSQSTTIYINRHGILDRILEQKIRQYLAYEESEGANLVSSLAKPIIEVGKVDVRDFPLERYIRCDSVWSIALLEACFLVYTDRYIEKCFVSEYSEERLKQSGISACHAPYFVPMRRGIRGCSHHRGKKFRDSAAYKRLLRSTPSEIQKPTTKKVELIPSGGKILKF